MLIFKEPKWRKILAVDKNNFSNGSYSESSGKTSPIWHMKVSLLEYFLASEKLYKSYIMSSVALNELCHPWWCHTDVIMVISTWLGDYTFMTENLCYKMKMWKMWVLTRQGGSSTNIKLHYWAWPSQDIPASAASVLTTLWLLCLSAHFSQFL